jgi:hypothetical protein
LLLDVCSQCIQVSEDKVDKGEKFCRLICTLAGNDVPSSQVCPCAQLKAGRFRNSY